MSELVIGCEIDNSGQYVWTSAIELRLTVKGNYRIKIISDPYEAFESSEISSSKFTGMTRSSARKLFNELCYAVYTLDGEFSLEYLVSQGDIIRFYDETGFIKLPNQ